MNEKELERLTDLARIERVEYQLFLENLKTMRQLENGIVIRRFLDK